MSPTKFNHKKSRNISHCLITQSLWPPRWVNVMTLTSDSYCGIFRKHIYFLCFLSRAIDLLCRALDLISSAWLINSSARLIMSSAQLIIKNNYVSLRYQCNSWLNCILRWWQIWCFCWPRSEPPIPHPFMNTQISVYPICPCQAGWQSISKEYFSYSLFFFLFQAIFYIWHSTHHLKWNRHRGWWLQVRCSYSCIILIHFTAYISFLCDTTVRVSVSDD